MKFDIWVFSKIRQENSSLIKIWGKEKEIEIEGMKTEEVRPNTLEQ